MDYGGLQSWKSCTHLGESRGCHVPTGEAILDSIFLYERQSQQNSPMDPLLASKT